MMVDGTGLVTNDLTNTAGLLFGAGSLGWLLWNTLQKTKIDLNYSSLITSLQKEKDELWKRIALLEKDNSELNKTLRDLSGASGGAVASAAAYKDRIAALETALNAASREVEAARVACDNAEKAYFYLISHMIKMSFQLEQCRGNLPPGSVAESSDNELNEVMRKAESMMTPMGAIMPPRE